ncbi:hypothetical protein K435DRAFT_648201 [Dendrothele bispora CBS 962.96]|uniref:GPI ethanolamine phosphate transferase 2 C-terminal domain-containing protein n=1 Tax=Dendrothele bispora (strain CBS 962.96) TaxID=1314807 RepID=A0A4S8MQ06_DENBC|nr:hypothetical protein K435DRAFT_648201 [Dendrothele bispora CBS 962.96]
MASRALLALLWVFFVHLSGLYLFKNGFLLTRLALTETTTCPNKSCTLQPTHSRAVFLIIDALRFDFLSPEPPSPLSLYHHNVLTLPAQLTSAHPEKSFIFNAYADPPTTTLQRIKGLTTGSLPTFVDIGNNFGGSSIAEDSIIKQLKVHGKKSAFMGDDTWMSVFPDSFPTNMTFPYDSFNVEDLHTVDEGVITHLFPLLEDQNKPFDFLVGHFLGVDHVGHRVGPDHPSMKAKLEQMNKVLTRVVELLDDDTLLVVLGDHGMDRSGDHGGDEILETSSGMWIYSKGRDLTNTESSVPSGLLQYTTFPGARYPYRSIQQIDILPTISLLLGLPIPFNNLGKVIPELFWRDASGTDLLRALELNADQIRNYLLAYRSSSSGGELDDAWQDLESAWVATRSPHMNFEHKLITLSNYTRVALSACRTIWAQFNPLLMSLGLALLAVSLLASWALYSGLSSVDYRWNDWLETKLWKSFRGLAGGASLGILLFLGLEPYLQGIDALDCIIFAAPFTSCVVTFFSTPPKLSFSGVPLLLLLHSLSFLSNSFTFWEDRIMTFFTISSVLPFVLTGFTAPTGRLRRRILGFSLLFAICVRLMAISTVCREEQQPYCHVTFYSSSSIPVAPKAILILVLPVTLAVPILFRRYLSISKSHVGLANVFLPSILTPSLLLGVTFWILEWMDTTELLESKWSFALRISRTWVARLCFFIALVLGGSLWYNVPLCISFESSETSGLAEKSKRQVKVIGFANAFGSPYLLFWSIFFSIVFATAQLTGQVVLGLFALALLSYLEVIDSARDVKMLEMTFASKPSSILDGTAEDSSPPIQFKEIVPLALLGLHAFYTTGHQSVISSIQWKSAFLLTPTMSYYVSGLTVFLNSLGPLFLVALAAPLLAAWNRSPKPAPTNPRASPESTVETVSLDAQVKGESVLAALGIMLHYASLLFGTAVSAAILRRHLMVWKVFAPRFMAGALSLLVIDVAAILGVSVGVERISKKVNQTLGGAFKNGAGR